MRWLDSTIDSMDMNLMQIPGDSGKWGSLVGCSPWSDEELDTI